jgi:anti-sigma-K factor RskA
MSIDLHTLTGAYALHATSDTERRAFERHLAHCPSCAQEGRELRETAARLGNATVTAPPPRLRLVVLTRIHTERQFRTTRDRVRVLAAGAAVLLLAATVFLGTTAVTGQHDLDQAQQHNAALTSVMAARDAHVTHGDIDGHGITVVVSPAQGRGVLLADLAPAPHGHTHQLWVVNSYRYRSAGLLADGPTIAELEGITTADHLAVTVEPDGGSPLPTTDPIIETALR